MKKIIASFIVLSTISMVSAQDATSSPILPAPPVTGDVRVDAQIRTLVQERNEKIREIHEEYQKKIKEIMEAKRAQMASTTYKMKEDKRPEDRPRATSTFEKIKQGFKFKGEVRGEATTTTEEEKRGFFDFFAKFFNQ